MAVIYFDLNKLRIELVIKAKWTFDVGRKLNQMNRYCWSVVGCYLFGRSAFSWSIEFEFVVLEWFGLVNWGIGNLIIEWFSRKWLSLGCVCGDFSRTIRKIWSALIISWWLIQWKFAEFCQVVLELSIKCD